MKPEDKLAAGRLLGIRMFPYFRPAIGKLIPVPMPGLGTFGVTKRFVMYYDPEVIEQWSESKVGAVISHEVCHPLRRHYNRAEAIGAVGDDDWNLAGDMEINDDLRPRCGKHLPDAVYPESMEFESGLAAEEYYRKIKDKKAEEQDDDGEDADGPIGPEGNGVPGDGDAVNGDENTPDSSEDDAGESDGDGMGKTKPEDNGESTGDSTADSESESDDPGADGEQGGSNGDSENSDSSDGGSDSSQSDSGDGIGRGKCGGCSGNPRSFEDALDEKYGRSDRDIEQAAKAVAELVKKAAANGKGDVPGGLVRWAEATLAPPQVLWQQKVQRALRNAIRHRAGAVDATFTRVSRRQAGIGFGPGRPVMTAYHAPLPKVACVVDTSGSVGSDDLISGVSEIGGVCRAVSCEVMFIACDSDAHGIHKVRNANDVKPLLLGGGGTDMAPAFKALTNMPPREQPDIIICITDGELFGDYPPEPKRTKVIWVMVRPTQTPPYGETIQINTGKGAA